MNLVYPDPPLGQHVHHDEFPGLRVPRPLVPPTPPPVRTVAPPIATAPRRTSCNAPLDVPLQRRTPLLSVRAPSQSVQDVRAPGLDGPCGPPESREGEPVPAIAAAVVVAAGSDVPLR